MGWRRNFRKRQAFWALGAILTWLSFSVAEPAAAQSAQNVYDPNGRLVGVIDPTNGSAQYNYDAAGNILSVVRNPNSTPLIVEVTPNSGIVGSTATIAGTFGTSASPATTGNTTVNFNGVAASPSSVTSTSVVVPVPSGATTGPVTVIGPNGTATSSASYTVNSAPAPPTITSFSPTTVAIGAAVAVTGTNFSRNPLFDKVYVNGQTAQITSATSTSLTITAPVASSGPITVQTQNGSATSGGNDLFVAPIGFSASQVASVQQTTLPPIGGSEQISMPISTTGTSILAFNGVAGQLVGGLVNSVPGADNNFYVNQTDEPSPSPDFLSLSGPNTSPALITDVGNILPLYNNAIMSPQLLTKTGTYTLTRSGPIAAAGTANITLYTVPAAASGTIASNGSPVGLTTTSPGQSFSLTFSGAAQQSVGLIIAVNQNFLNYPAGGIQDEFGNYIPYAYAFGITVTGPSSQTVYSTSWNQTTGNGVSFGNPGVGVGNFDLPALVLPANGTYTVTLTPTGPSGADFGTATFILNNMPPAAGGAISANGTVNSYTTTVPGQNFNLTFGGLAGEQLSLAVVDGDTDNIYHWASSALALTITDQYGNAVYSNPGTMGNLDFTGGLTLPTTGTYTISVIPTAGAVGTLNFSLFSGAPFANTAIPANGTPLTLTSAFPGQNFTTTFTGTAGQIVNPLLSVTSGLSINPEYFDTNLDDYGEVEINNVTITRPDGTVFYNSPVQLFGGNFGTYLGGIQLPQTGTYTINFSPIMLPTSIEGSSPFNSSAMMGTASFSLGPISSGTISANGVPVSAGTTVAGEYTTLTFSGTAGEQVQLTTAIGSTSGSSNPWYLQVVEPTGIPQYTGYGFPGNYVPNGVYTAGISPGSTNVSNVFTLPQPGTYTISLAPPSGAYGTATVALSVVPPTTSGATISPGTTAAVAISTPGQTAQLKFQETAGHRISLLTQGTPIYPQPNFCYGLSITAPDNTQLYNSSSVDNYTCNSAGFSGVLPAPASTTTTIPTLTQTGTYTLTFAPSTTSTGSVSFSLYDVPTDVTGQIIVGGPLTSLTTTVPGQSARATFLGAALGLGLSGRVINVSTGAPGCYNITTIAPDGSTIVRADSSCTPTYSSGPLLLPQTGIYTVVVTPQGGTTGTYRVGVTLP